MKKIIFLFLTLLIINSVSAQENTVLGTGALSQATTPKHIIKEIQVTSAGSYSRPSLEFGAHAVAYEYNYVYFSGTGCYFQAMVKSLTSLGNFVPTVVGGLGTGATVEIYLMDVSDGYYYYEIYSADYGTGYVPIVTISPSTTFSYDILAEIDVNNKLDIYYSDWDHTNVYTTAPAVYISFGGALATAVLETTAVNAQNTAVGYQALGNTNGPSNVAVGDRAGVELTSGKNNTFIGVNAGKGITTGSGNTILGRTSVNLASSLSNTVLVADGNGNNKMVLTPNGNALVGYGNTLTDNGYRLDVNGGGRFVGKVQAGDIDGYEAVSISANKVLEVNGGGFKKLYQMPTTKAYHDVFAFNKKGHQITYEESSDKLSFVPGVLNTSFFAQKSGTAAQIDILNATTKQAVRWTWSNTTYTNSQWLALDYGSVSGSNAYTTIKVEHSVDNINWITNHTSSYGLSSSGSSRYHNIGYSDDSGYLRLTITHNGGGIIRLCGIRLLTTRLGNHGAAPEYAFPYTWNKEGWIGINKGIAEPEYPLDVTGSSRLSGTVILQEPTSSSGSYDLLTRNSSSGVVEKINVNLPTSGGFDLQGSTARGNSTTNNIIAQSFGVRYSDGSSYQTIGADAAGLGMLYRSFVTSGNTSAHSFRGSDATDLVTVMNGGNVGIGIANPQEKLSVNGKIRAKEIKVEPVNNWPDYVFEESYKPLKLAEVAAFVKKYKHLPEVPSAKEVAAHGLELGEMNKVLLKKIEELTIYLIEKEDQLNQTNKRIDQLGKLLKELIEKTK